LEIVFKNINALFDPKLLECQQISTNITVRRTKIHSPIFFNSAVLPKGVGIESGEKA